VSRPTATAVWLGLDATEAAETMCSEEDGERHE